MSVNYFVGQSFEWLEKELALCQGDLARGKTLAQWGAGDSQGQSKIQLTPQYRFQLIYAALSAAEDAMIARGELTEETRKYPSTSGHRTIRTTPRYL